MGKTLKVLNAVRQFEVGIPVTHYQYAIFLFVDVYQLRNLDTTIYRLHTSSLG
jgi:hypothetical protein